MSVLVTGGLGYIGSHTVVELLNENHEIIIIDNQSNSSEKVIDRIHKITNKKVIYYKMDVLDKEGLKNIFQKHEIQSVVHFAGFKSVSESVSNPLKYYHNNVVGLINLCEVMNEFKVYNLVFSSSATVYGITNDLPLTEKHETGTINPYGETKLMSENILKDLATSNPEWKVVILRYFNPVGAHESGLIGEETRGAPSNLMPYITQVSVGRLEELKVYGNNYPTKDGTGVRDYIHVVDLAKGHVKAIEKLADLNSINIYNLGTGNGYSVLEIIQTFEKVNGVTIPYEIVEKRPGDVASSYADSSKAKEDLNWESNKHLKEMCVDAFRWENQREKERLLYNEKG